MIATTYKELNEDDQTALFQILSASWLCVMCCLFTKKSSRHLALAQLLLLLFIRSGGGEESVDVARGVRGINIQGASTFPFIHDNLQIIQLLQY